MIDKLINDGELIIKGEFSNRKVEYDLLRTLDFSIDTLNEDIVDQSKIAAIVEAMYSSKKSEVEVAEYDYKFDRAKMYVKMKTNITDVNGKPYSDVRIEAMLDSDPELDMMYRRILMKKAELRKLQNALSRVKERKDMLQSYSSNVRNSQ